MTLLRLARCLRDKGEPAAAEVHVRKAITIFDRSLQQESRSDLSIYNQHTLLVVLGDVLRDQGKISQAREVYEESLSRARKQQNLHSLLGSVAQMGYMALEDRNHDEAYSLYTEAFGLARTLGDLERLAEISHQLGRVAQIQKDWPEAERYYRESLIYKDQLNDVIGTVLTYHQLAIVASADNRPREAEGWYKRALELDKRLEPGSLRRAVILTNLADLLLAEVQAGRASLSCLPDVQSYAEEALAIKKPLEASAEIWRTLDTLAVIAEMEGGTESARDYRRQAREAFAISDNNRRRIDYYKPLTDAVVRAARGDVDMRAAVETALCQWSR